MSTYGGHLKRKGEKLAAQKLKRTKAIKEQQEQQQKRQHQQQLGKDEAQHERYFHIRSSSPSSNPSSRPRIRREGAFIIETTSSV
ncbi:uncharacterized protein Dwil_GK26897 [Drosophila willistoni]|uniref:Uncharacterized protein n=1 Tax=Drosophila willistoni TaxID=7260 RepID=A0A0Q9X211_DROWI|nr:uncharacterized protein Dwil_GK26897 [Drosophila willistoni]